MSDEVLWAARAAIAGAAHGRGWRNDPPIAALLDDLAREHGEAAAPAPGALAAAARAFGLDDSEAQVLAVVAAVELDVRFGALFARMQGGADALRPSVGTLLELFGRGGARAFLPESRLRRHALLDADGEAPLVFRTVRCPERVWTRLAGHHAAEPAASAPASELVLTDAVRGAVDDLAGWLGAAGGGLVVIWGRPGSGRHAIAGAILAGLGTRPWHGRAESISNDGWQAFERDARWAGAVPVVAAGAATPPGAALAWLASSAAAPRIWIQDEVPDWLSELQVPAQVLHVPAPDHDHRVELWRRLLGDAPGAPSPAELAGRYRFGPGRIARVVALARTAGGLCAAALAAASRATTRAGVNALAERMSPRARDELVVPAACARDLDLAIAWASSHARLYGAWGLSTGIARARGVTCLFAGPPGTGKTLAAQIVAGAVERDLFRVDLAQAVSKWLGETEKNLSRLFDEAAEAGAVLFFDEADALFAKRTQVSNAHDRYANLETNYLLQRLESHDGVVILATNRRQDLDAAFQRRFDVIIEFAAPGLAERERLWQRHLPPSVHVASDVDASALARMFELSGGQIRNAVVRSAAVATMRRGPAATDGDLPSLTMAALVDGAVRELVRAGRLINPADYGAWSGAVREALGAPPV